MTRWAFSLSGKERAVRGAYYWLYRYTDGNLHVACSFAFKAGIRIPYETYGEADPKVSQGVFKHLGQNTTAILPFEVD